MKKIFLPIFIILLAYGLLVGFLYLLIILSDNNFSFQNTLNFLTDFSGVNRGEPSITLFAVGDIMLDRGVDEMVKEKGSGDFRFPFFLVADYLKKADILFGNLESVISDKEGEKAEKTGSVQVYLKAKPEAIEGLVYAGFDIVSVANNHALDYGRQVFEDSLKRLEKADIEYIGGGFNNKETFSVKIKEIKGTKIGFLAYTYPKFDGTYIPWKPTEEESGVAVIEKKELEKIEQEIAKAKKEVDILIVSSHRGEEYSLQPSEEQILFDKAFIDSGADLVIGHHPHVLQPLEKYKNGWIAYSLGNFIFDMTSEETKRGAILEVTIKNKKIERVVLKETKNSDFFQPYLK